MMKRQIHFYAVKDDLLEVLEIVERAGSLDYARKGVFTTPNTESFGRGAEIPALGMADSSSASGCKTFLVVTRGTPINIRPIDLVSGGRHYAVDQLINLDSVTFTPAGLRSEGLLLYGCVATTSKSIGSQQLMKRFYSAIRKKFSRIKAFYVGTKARELLERGARLAVSEQSPTEYDLVI
jgi:hypothetical protein